PRRLVEWLDAEPPHQFTGAEGILADAEDQSQQPLLTRHRVQEPALGTGWRRNFDGAAMLPVRLGKVAELVNLLIEPVKDRSFPAGRLALGGNALDRMPALAIGFPGHGRVLADILESEVVLPRLLGRKGIELRSLDVRSGLQHFGKDRRRV